MIRMNLVFESLANVARSCADKPAEVLTEHERIALAVMAGCEITTEVVDGNTLRVTTKNPVGVVKIDGKFVIGEAVARAGDRIRLQRA